MQTKYSLDEAKELALKFMRKGYHCGPAVLQVMWDVYDLGNEDVLWSCVAFMGGISGEQQAPCGAVSASAVCLGLRHCCSLSDKEKAKQSRTIIRSNSGKLVRDFQEKFGNITCAGLLGIDFSKPGAYQEFRKSGVWKDKCNKYIEFIVEKLYEFEDGKGTGEKV